MVKTDWVGVYLRALGAPNTPANRRFLLQWQRWEGGHTNNDARYNYLNTTQRMQGSSSINSVGVQSYRSLAQGARAFAKTLKNGRYGDLLGALRSGDPVNHNVARGLSVWVSGDPNSEQGAQYASKVLGTNVKVPKVPQTPAPAPVESGGGADFATMALANLDQAAQRGGRFDPMAMLDNLATTLAAIPDKGAQVIQAPRSGQQIQVAGKPDKTVQKVVGLVDDFLGVPYVWGGESPQGFDCSGLLQYVWGKNGVKIPRVTYDQWRAGKAVGKGQLRPGDAVFFHMGKNGPEHVGMYIGRGRFIEAPHSGAVVRISKLAGRKDFVGARRFH